MQTILDTGYSWFLEKLVYEEKLEIYILEAKLSNKPKELIINKISFGKSYTLNIADRRFIITFEQVLAYHMAEENYTFTNDYDIKSKGVICKYERSHYLDFIKVSSLIDSLKSKQYVHYGLILENHIIDIICLTEPKILQL